MRLNISAENRLPGRFTLVFGMMLFAAAAAPATGPENLVLLANRQDADSLAVANHYRRMRHIPNSHVVVLDFPPNRKEMAWVDFSRTIYEPTLDVLRRRGLMSRIGVIATTPGFPYRVGRNGLSGVWFFGREEQTNTLFGPASFATLNGYVDRFEPFAPSTDGKSPMFLHMHLDAGNLANTLAMIDRSVAADGSEPPGTVYLLDGEGPRATRKESIPLASRLLECLSVNNVPSTTSILRGRTDVLGLYSGVSNYPVAENRYVKGALGDLLTSVSGQLLDNHTQTRATEWLAAGCSATYGTVVEPYNYPQKFPSAKAHVFYAMGFPAVEAYWMSVLWPQQGLFLGDPLTRPFGKPPRLEFSGIEPNQVFENAVRFSAVASVDGEGPGVAAVEMFLDDKLVGVFGRKQLTDKAVLKLRIDDFELSGELPASGQLIDLLKPWQKQLADRRIDSILGPGIMILLIPQLDKRVPSVTVESGNRVLYAAASKVSGSRGERKPAAAAWAVDGNPAVGDRLTLELMDIGKPTSRHVFEVRQPMSAAELALRLTAELAPTLPAGYSFDGRMMPMGGKRIGRITLEAPTDSFVGNPRVRLRLERTVSSSLQLNPGDAIQSMMDATLNSYAVALLRFGIGDESIRVNADLPTRELAEGRHELRFVARRGWPAQPQTRQIIPFIVRKQEKRLRVVCTRKIPEPVQLSVRQPPIAVARAEYDGDGPLLFEFYVDGEPVRPQEMPNRKELVFDPRYYGQGMHSVTVVGKSSIGVPIRSDNALRIEVLP